MKKIAKKDKRTDIEKEIARVTEILSQIDPKSTDYRIVVEHLERLRKAATYETRKGISPDTVFATLGNLAGIGLILGYEHAHVITSKALSFVTKTRIK